MSRPVCLRVVLTLSAIAIAITHVVWPNVRIDGVTLGLIGLAALPWLAPIIKSVDLPGIGKIELQEVKAQVDELRGQTASASQKANTALASRASSLSTIAFAPDALQPDQRLSILASKYNDIRKTQKSGGLRTGAMTEVVGEMIDLASSVSSNTVFPLLIEEDDGKRLFAYAYIYTRPEPQILPDLVHSVTEIEKRPFGQYWGIQAIGRVIQTAPQSANAQILNSLRRLLAKLQRDTDRYYELSRIIKSLEVSS